jgi:hypothetical protein
MYKVDAYIDNPLRKTAKLRQLGVKRDWMHPITYNCHPVTFANTLGYGVYFDEDISFVWEGDVREPAIGVIGKEYTWQARSEGTISFLTNLIFKTDKDTSLLIMPVPNQFNKEATVVTSILSTSFFTGELHIVWKIDPEYIGKEILVPAGTNVACLLPVSIKQFHNSNINMMNTTFPFAKIQDKKEYVEKMKNYFDENGSRIKMYKKAIDENENIIGEHEVDNLIMSVTEK